MARRTVALLLALIAMAALTTPAQAAGKPPTRDFRMSILDSSRLTIGWFPKFPYDGGDTASPGRLTRRPSGSYDLRMPKQTLQIPPLEMVWVLPQLPLEVEIKPNRGMTGRLDLCSGRMTMAFDATFQPRAFFYRPRSLSVVTPLTTGQVDSHGVKVSGRPLGRDGRLRLAGVAWVPKTGDPLVDNLLQLPTKAVAELDVRMTFPTGRPSCHR